MATKTNELGSLELPATTPHRVVAVGATYLDATETLGPDGKPTVAYISKVAYRGETVELNAHQARRLIDLGAVKSADEPLSYDERKVEDLGAAVAASAPGGVTVSDERNQAGRRA
jgi:hypothetical protein